LINDPFSDPVLFIPFQFRKRALLCDLGDLSGLSVRDLLKVTHVFVTHTHMDHFIGLDTLLRVMLGRDKVLCLFGPPGFTDRVEGKLSGYTWNLVREYETHLTLHVTEIHEDHRMTKTYLCREGFQAGRPAVKSPFEGILHQEPAFRIYGRLLDHRVPCLGISLEERFQINIIKEGLREAGLRVGPWINRFKEALYEGENPDGIFRITWEENGTVIKEKCVKLGELKQKIARISPGKKYAYVTDILGSEDNYEKVIALARGADHFFIEAAFLWSDRAVASKKCHLTAREAGDLAGKAGVKRFTVFHFSPRYRGREEEIRAEAVAAFRSTRSCPHHTSTGKQ
jgi:ribonuclease Z